MTKSAGPMCGCRWAAECNLVAPAGAGVNDFILMGITTVLSCGVLWNKCCTRQQRELSWGNELCHCLLMPCSKHWNVFSCHRLSAIIIFYKQQLPVSFCKTQTPKVMLLKMPRRMNKFLSNRNSDQVVWTKNEQYLRCLYLKINLWKQVQVCCGCLLWYYWKMVKHNTPWHVIKVSTPKTKEMEREFKAMLLNFSQYSIFICSWKHYYHIFTKMYVFTFIFRDISFRLHVTFLVD